jgi:DNA primase
MSEAFFEKLTDVCHNLLLHNEDLMYYLKECREMTDETIREYKLGAFPKDLRELYNRYNMDPVELRKQNIVVNAEYSPFKLFPIVIPIRDVQGHHIAIGCRTLLSEEKRKQFGIPKYRNSVYKKTSHLFGLDRAMKMIRQKDKVFVVEGYFDAITAHQKDALNVVATCGTIFTERQLIMLSRYTKNICLLFDNDAPGRQSAKKVVDKLNKYIVDINLTCSFTPEGYKDLDEYLRKGGSVDLFYEQELDLKDAEVKTLW